MSALRCLLADCKFAVAGARINCVKNFNIAGSALMSIVGVYKEIQDQHMNIVSALQCGLPSAFLRQSTF